MQASLTTAFPLSISARNRKLLKWYAQSPAGASLPNDNQAVWLLLLPSV
jgi:hypothetical protein